MLELDRVHAGYGGHAVLRDVSLVVPDRSVVALLGPNGAGKTTTLRTAIGQVTATSGRIFLGGVDVTAQRADQRASAGLCLIPEGRAVFSKLTVRENLRLLAPSDAERQAAEIAIASFPPLGKRLDQVAGTMSGGEQQMLAIARAFISRPEVIMIDEASMGLAPRIVDEIFEAMRLLAQGGTSLLIVEQYIDRALGLADFVYLLRRGSVIGVFESDGVTVDAIEASYLGGIA